MHPLHPLQTYAYEFLGTSYRYIKKNKYLCAMNKFDYTSVPRSLLYCNRRYLDDFDVDNPNSLNYHIEKAFGGSWEGAWGGT
jgi:hypothetical protein